MDLPVERPNRSTNPPPVSAAAAPSVFRVSAVPFKPPTFRLSAPMPARSIMVSSVVAATATAWFAFCRLAVWLIWAPLWISACEVLL